MSAQERLLQDIEGMSVAERERVALELARRGAVVAFKTKPWERAETYAAGPWDAEPYGYVEWTDAWTGLRCWISRNEYGSWCGYVRLPKGSPLLDLDINDLNVHGGVTWCRGDVVGFDCYHSFDASPSRPEVGEYRNMLFARSETEALAWQIAQLETP